MYVVRESSLAIVPHVISGGMEVSHAPDHGGHRDSGSTSGAAILAAFIPTFAIACVYLVIFAVIRDRFRKFYSPRTFLETVAEKDRTPEPQDGRFQWIRALWNLSDAFILRHNSLDAYLYLRFLRFIIGICALGALLIWPILLPINANGGGKAKQLDRLSFSNIAHNDYLWAHLVVAWIWFGCVFLAIAHERLQLIGIRQAQYLRHPHSARVSARTVLFLNVPSDALRSQNLQRFFGDQAERSWPVKPAGQLDDIVQQRNSAAFALESAQLDLVRSVAKRKPRDTSNTDTEEAQSLLAKSQRPVQRSPPIIGKKSDKIHASRQKLEKLITRVDEQRAHPASEGSGSSAMFVSFKTQEAAHRAFQIITFHPRLPTQDRYLSIQPKEVLWQNLALPVENRLSKASLALAFVIVFTIFFSIPVGLLGTISNAGYLADRVTWLRWLRDLPSPIFGLLTGLLPPFLTSWFVSYVPKLFRKIAKLSGEPTTAQAELKTQAWYIVFQVFQVFLVTTFSSGAAAVASQIAQNPASTPDLLASSLPKASNFYLTYFILQGTTGAASNFLKYSDLFELLFYEWFWDKTPRQQFSTFAQMKGTPWASWYPKFTNFLIIATVYSCIAPLTLGFAGLGIFFYYLSYRYSMLYVRQTKIDTKGEAYKRALQQMPIGLYLAELCLIGLFGARKAATQFALMIVILILTAGANLLLDRMLKPLELYLGVDKWQEQEVPLFAEEDGINPNDQSGLHAVSHGRRLGLIHLPGPLPRWTSEFLDSIISSARDKARSWLEDQDTEEDIVEFSDAELEKLYLAPAFTSKVPKLWIPSDRLGVSKQEIGENEAAGILTTDEAAEVDDDGRLHWNHHFENVPIYSKPKVI